MTAVIDHVLFLAIAVGLPLYGIASWRRLVRRAAQGIEEARLESYTETIILEWALAAAVLTAWLAGGRAPASIGLAQSTETASAVAWIISAAIAALLFAQVRAVRLAIPAGLREQLAVLEPLMPHSRGERSVFTGVSLTAGFCEELLYRGFVLAYLTPWVGGFGAVTGSTILFAAVHAYQGVTGILKTMVVGLVLATLTVYAGSLWPAVLLHVAIDLQAGAIGYEVFGHAAADAADRQPVVAGRTPLAARRD